MPVQAGMHFAGERPGDALLLKIALTNESTPHPDPDRERSTEAGREQMPG